MKRAASILLLGILFFNWVGYRVFVSYLQDQKNEQLEAQLDREDYNESDLILLKVPAAHLSAYTNSHSFERVDGQLEISGITYKYVKRRLYNDTLELLCIPNLASMQLQHAKSDFFKIVNDIQNTAQNKKGNSPSVQKNFPVSFCPIQLISLTNELCFSGIKRPDHFHLPLPSPFIAQPGEPPQV